MLQNNPKASSFNNPYKNPVFITLVFLVFGLIFLAYSNHFSNTFVFDDAHTIQDNVAIKEINVVAFFTDASTFSSLPTNQTYRPFVTLENAIDYKIAGGLHTKAFHVHIFIMFLLVCGLLFLLVKKILDFIDFSNHNHYWGLLVAAIFGTLCANAETVNYIIQRAEIDAAFFILAGFVAYLHGGIWKNKHLYLIFPFIGFFAKEMTSTFAPLLFLYLLIFEEKVYLLQFYKPQEFKKCITAFKKVLPAVILTCLFLVFYFKMQKFSSGSTDTFLYLITQPAVMCHYIITYFVPYNLSLDSDWKLVDSIFDFRAIVGIVLICQLIYIALKASKNEKTRLFSFGILWFFVSLLPTSSVIPFAEVLNDHRAFIPYIGLTIAFVFGLKYMAEKYFESLLQQSVAKKIIAVVVVIFLGANAYGVHQRNKVWNTELSLWKDASEKSPNNGRAHMNYGLQLMAIGDYANAEISFNKSAELNPYYANVYINLGILKNATGNAVAAEENFKKALSCDNYKHLSHYYYANFLLGINRIEEAEQNLLAAIALVPNFYNAQSLQLILYHKTNNWEQLKNVANSILLAYPNDENAKKYLDIALNKKPLFQFLVEDALQNPTPEKYLDLSLKYFQAADYLKCIAMANKALQLKPDYSPAYNNIGIAYVNLQDYENAIMAYNNAIKFDPNNQLAKNNLAQALLLKNGINNSPTGGNNMEVANEYLNLSLKYYNEQKYKDCIEAAKKSIEANPTSAAYNNICAAYNQLNQPDLAIEACNNALKLDTNNQLARGNLGWALSLKK